MSQLVWLSETDLDFPDVSTALDDPNGLLAASEDLTEERLLAAYQRGIFPWYDEGQPVLWWSPDPRCVIAPLSFTPSKSLGKRLRRKDYEIRIDTDFETVIEECSKRSNGEGTWITDDICEAYTALHYSGHAHCIECYIDNELAGGLYGIGMGDLFFGESMFHRKTDASKIAFTSLMRVMADNDSPMVDCQLTNPHLLSLGAYEIPRSQFITALETGIAADPIDWAALQGTFTL
jgi:leucyl/phenylalanyl-tRNA--protein transferase